MSRKARLVGLVAILIVVVFGFAWHSRSGERLAVALPEQSGDAPGIRPPVTSRRSGPDGIETVAEPQAKFIAVDGRGSPVTTARLFEVRRLGRTRNCTEKHLIGKENGGGRWTVPLRRLRGVVAVEAADEINRRGLVLGPFDRAEVNHILLRSRTTFLARCVDRQGHAVAGVRIRMSGAMLPDDDSESDEDGTLGRLSVFGGTSDASGRLEIAGIAEGRYMVELRHRTHVLSNPEVIRGGVSVPHSEPIVFIFEPMWIASVRCREGPIANFACTMSHVGEDADPVTISFCDAAAAEVRSRFPEAASVIFALGPDARRPPPPIEFQIVVADRIGVATTAPRLLADFTVPETISVGLGPEGGAVRPVFFQPDDSPVAFTAFQIRGGPLGPPGLLFPAKPAGGAIGLPPGRYRVSPRMPCTPRDFDAVSFYLASGEHKDLPIRLKRTLQEVRVEVLTDSGDSIARTPLMFEYSDGSSAQGVTEITRGFFLPTHEVVSIVATPFGLGPTKLNGIRLEPTVDQITLTIAMREP